MKKALLLNSCTLALLLAGNLEKAAAQAFQKQDPDRLLSRERAAGNVRFTPLTWTNADADFGPLPASVHVFRSTDSLNGRPSIAYYVTAQLSDAALKFTTQVGYGKRLTPTEYYQQEQHPLLIINSAFFSFATNGNLDVTVRDGKMVAWNQPSHRNKRAGTGNADSAYVYHTPGALGISQDRKADVAWTFTDTTQPWPYAFENAPVVAYGKDTAPTIAAMHNTHWQTWKMETVVGGGPVLVHDGKIRVTNEAEDLFVKGENDLHPRSAIGYTKEGKLIILAVQGRTPGQAEGISLREEARLFLDLGCYEAVNLDGGGSSCLLINGKETIHPTDKEGERPVPSVFIIQQQ